MILLAIALSLLAAAQPFKDIDKEELALTNVVFAPGAPAVVLDWTVDRDDDHSRETESVRIKVLTDEGKKYANIELPYQKRESGIRDLSARTIQPDGSVVPFDGRTFDKLVVRVRRENMMAKTFTLPDVRVGSIIEYRYTREWGRDSVHFAQWELEREIPILHERISFRPWSGPLAVFYTGLSIPGNKKPEFVDKKYELELRNLPPFEKEPFAPPEVRTKAILIFFYRMSNTTTTDYWANAAGFESHVFEDFMKETPEIVNEARQITGGAANDEEKLRRIYARVQKIRNLSYEREKSDEEVKRERLKENKSAGDVLRNGYASGNQLDQLFIALARAAGFVVEPVLVSDRDEPFSKEIPEIRQLSDLTARVMIGGQPRYFDPGCPFIPFGQLRWDHVLADALVSPKKGAPQWVRTSDVPALLSVTKRHADLQIDGDALAGSVHIAFTGEEALQRRLAHHLDDEAAQKKAIEDEVKAWFPNGSTVKVTKLAAMIGADEPLTADFDVKIPNIVSSTGSRLIVPLSIFETAAKNPFTSAFRKQPVFFDFAYAVDDVVRFRLPDGYAIESLPEAAKNDSGALKYAQEASAGDGDFTFRRLHQIDAAFIPRDRYTIVRKFFGDVVTADQVTATLKKKTP